ncbi:MAG: transcriptional repressor [Desulfobacter sp.]|nr:MAG: transcriptional repressor [Desulfobacter sp.]
MDLFYEQCKAHNLKITPQRVAVYKALSSSLSHPSADQIHKELKKEFPNISLDTVNRTLLTFAKADMIDVVEGHGDPRRFDPNRNPHHHFYCVSCRKIFDFKDDDLDRLPLSPEIENKFTVTGKRVCLTGYCDKCRHLHKEGSVH